MTSLTSFSHQGASAQKVIQLDSNGTYHNWDVPGWLWNGQGWAGMAGSVMEWEIEAGTGGNAGQFRLTHTDPGNSHGHNGSTAWVSPDSTTGIVTLPMNVLFNLHGLAALFCKPPAAGIVTNSVNTGSITQNSAGLYFQVDATSDVAETYTIQLASVPKATIIPSGVGPWELSYTALQHTAIGYGQWTLIDSNNTLSSYTTTAPTNNATSKKKVFCNFW